MASLNRRLSKLPQGVAFAFSPPAIPGIGTAGGVTFILEDRAGKDITFLWENTQKFLEEAKKRPEIARVTTTFLPTVPQIFVNVDRDKVLKQGVDLSQVYRTLQAFMGGYFVNYFNRFGRQWQVYVQAEGEYRTEAGPAGPVLRAQQRRRHRAAVDADVTIEQRSGPEFTMRYNLYRSAQINAVPNPGYSSDPGHAGAGGGLRRDHAAGNGLRLPGHELIRRKRPRKACRCRSIFALSLLFVFLILAAQYESWSLPFSVLSGHARRGVRGLCGAFSFAAWSSTSTRRSA